MLVIFVHGWGVRKADYGSLPGLLQTETMDIWLSEYISYCDDITLEDLADAFERARLSDFPNQDFACVTHSTGGPVMRTWLDRYAGPMRALVMLAPPNHGSALAQLGKSRLSRLKSWMEGVEPGQRILDWLELGSEGSWALNERWLDSTSSCRILVLSGTTPDRSFYDHLNSYTGERASDGVVRLASANLNYSLLRLRQSGGGLQFVESKRSPKTRFVALAGSSHSGILKLESSQQTSSSASMMIFKVVDTSGESIDFDLLLTAGPNYSPDELPVGFFIDRQRNRVTGTLTYFVDYTVMKDVKHFGFAVLPRPSSGPVSYERAEFRSSLFLRPHETVLIEITLQRLIEDRVFITRYCE